MQGTARRCGGWRPLAGHRHHEITPELYLTRLIHGVLDALTGFFYILAGSSCGVTPGDTHCKKNSRKERKQQSFHAFTLVICYLNLRRLKVLEFQIPFHGAF